MNLTKFTKQLITDEEMIANITMDARDIWENEDGNQWISNWNGNLILNTHEKFFCGGEWRSTDIEMFLLTPINE